MCYGESIYNIAVEQLYLRVCVYMVMNVCMYVMNTFEVILTMGLKFMSR